MSQHGVEKLRVELVEEIVVVQADDRKIGFVETCLLQVELRVPRRLNALAAGQAAQRISVYPFQVKVA